MNTVKERKKGGASGVYRERSVMKPARKGKEAARRDARTGEFLVTGDVAAPEEGVFKKIEVKKRGYVMIPEAAYREMVEDIRDARAFVKADQDDGETVPGDVVDRLMSGDNPIKVYREWRGLTQEALAGEVESGKLYISQIETGHREPSLDMARRLARALGVNIDDLVSDAAGV
ncbi:MAG: helix-turn-helix transcriptional regulator [Micavibrio sp.]